MIMNCTVVQHMLCAFVFCVTKTSTVVKHVGALEEYTNKD